MSANNPCKVVDILSGKVKLCPFGTNIVYSPKHNTTWHKDTNSFDYVTTESWEAQLTHDQFLALAPQLVQLDPDALVITFISYNYFIAQDRVYTDCAIANGEPNRGYLYAENNNPKFNYLRK